MIITYHEIVHEASRYLYAVDFARFTGHIEFLRLRSALGGTPVGITFDDGLDSHRCRASDALQEAGFRGTFFVTPKWTGARGYMDVAALKELVAAGHDVQSHGWSHKLLSRCGPQELVQELERSKEALEDWIGREVDALSTPGGACSRTVIRAAAETGYKRVYTSDPWLMPRTCEGILVAGRLMLRNSTTTEMLDRLLSTEGRLFSIPRLAYTARRMVRATMGVSMYHHLWCFVAREGRRQPERPVR